MRTVHVGPGRYKISIHDHDHDVMNTSTPAADPFEQNIAGLHVHVQYRDYMYCTGSTSTDHARNYAYQ